jgi:polar amino acid transport system ATP-binding protein
MLKRAADGGPLAPLIEVRHVTKSFGEVRVLDDVSFAVRPSEVTCIIGPSGSGKSTLLRAMAFLETYDSGEILCGQPSPRSIGCGAMSAWCFSSSTSGRT